jgi:hypothetical protein
MEHYMVDEGGLASAQVLCSGRHKNHSHERLGSLESLLRRARVMEMPKADAPRYGKEQWPQGTQLGDTVSPDQESLSPTAAEFVFLVG